MTQVLIMVLYYCTDQQGVVESCPSDPNEKTPSEGCSRGDLAYIRSATSYWSGSSLRQEKVKGGQEKGSVKNKTILTK